MNQELNEQFTEHLDELWDPDIDESARQKGVKLLQQICRNILKDPSNRKFRDLNFEKIGERFDQCQPALLLLFAAGFTLAEDAQRLQLDSNEENIAKITALQEALHNKQEPQHQTNGVESKVSLHHWYIMFPILENNMYLLLSNSIAIVSENLHDQSNVLLLEKAIGSKGQKKSAERMDMLLLSMEIQ